MKVAPFTRDRHDHAVGHTGSPALIRVCRGRDNRARSLPAREETSLRLTAAGCASPGRPAEITPKICPLAFHRTDARSDTLSRVGL